MGRIEPHPDETMIAADGGLVLPGLHDHHVHLLATAAAQSSLVCGPPEVVTADALMVALRRPGEGWIRGTGYHESVAGMLDRRWIDALVPDRPVRIQHRGGRMWFFNSLGMEHLLASGLPPPASLDRQSGRLFDSDAWLRRALSGSPPALSAISQMLSQFGVTGVTDMGAGNGVDAHAILATQQGQGHLQQRLMLAGREELSELAYNHRLTLGALKIHLHEAQLPDLDELIIRIASAHARQRVVAIHCVTLAELVFALVAFREAGVHCGDRIEHASMATDAEVREMGGLGLSIAVQPMFVQERGDAYLRDIDDLEWPLLYRFRAFADAGIALAGSSDAPYVSIDPWAAMNAAVHRHTQAGDVLGAGETLDPEQALNLFLAAPEDLGALRRIEVGTAADLCLLDRPWRDIRDKLSSSYVRLTSIDGSIVYDRSSPE